MKHKRTQSTKWIAGVVIATTAALALIILWFHAWAPLTKADFRTAQQQVDQLTQQVTASDDAANDYIVASADSLRFDPTGKKIDSDTTKDKQAFTAALSAYTKQLDVLKHLRVTRDTQVAAAINQVSNQTDMFQIFLKIETNEYPTFYRATIDCDGIERFVPTASATANASAFSTLSKDCLRSLDALSKVTLSAFNGYAVEKANVVRNLNQTYTDLAVRNANVSNLHKKLASLNQQILQFDPLGDLQKAHDRAVTHAAIDTLGRILKEKQ